MNNVQTSVMWLWQVKHWVPINPSIFHTCHRMHLGSRGQNRHSHIISGIETHVELCSCSLSSMFTAFLYVCDEAALIILYLGVTRSASPGGTAECVTIPPTLKPTNRKTREHRVPKHKPSRTGLVSRSRGLEAARTLWSEILRPISDSLRHRPLLCFFFLEPKDNRHTHIYAKAAKVGTDATQRRQYWTSFNEFPSVFDQVRCQVIIADELRAAQKVQTSGAQSWSPDRQRW